MVARAPAATGVVDRTVPRMRFAKDPYNGSAKTFKTTGPTSPLEPDLKKL